MARREKRKRCPVRFATSALVPCQFGERIGGTCLIWAQTRTPRPGSVSHVLWMTWRLCRLVVGVDSVRVWTETEGDFGRREMGVSEDALAFCENYVTVIKTDALCSNQFSSLFCCFEIWGFSIFIYFYFLLLVTIFIHGILRPFIQATFGWKRIHHPNWSREKNKNLFIYLFFCPSHN